MKKFNTWANRNPLVVVWGGVFVCFVLMELAAAIIKH